MTKFLPVASVFLLIMVVCFCSGVSFSQNVNPSTDANSQTNVPAQPSTDPQLQAWKVPLRSPAEMHALTNLENLMKFFTTMYTKEQAKEQKAEHTIILFRLSGATLIKDGKIIETVRVIPSEYHNLRYAAHVPFTVFLILNPLCGLTLSASDKTDIQDLLDLINKAEPEIDNTGLSPNQLARQHRLFQGAISFLQKVLTNGTVSEEELESYARMASIDMDQNMREAGAAQVNGIHNQLLKWRQQMSDAEWRSVLFIVHGPQQPRDGSAITLYLSALLKDPGNGRGYEGESGHIVYREDDTTPFVAGATKPWDDDLQLLAAINLDRIASQAFFSDPHRLDVDIVSDGAHEQIRHLDFSALQPIGY